MKVSDIKTPVSSIAGIGPQLTKTLAKVNVFTVGDLLQYYPRDYEDRTRKVCFREQAANYGKVHTVARVMAHEWFGYGRMKTLKIIVTDGSGTAELICFNRAFLEKSLVPGTIITVTGKFEVKYGKLQSTAFEAIKHTEIPVVECPPGRIETTATLDKSTGSQGGFDTPASQALNHRIRDLTAIPPKESGVIPIYPLTEGLTQKAVSKAVGHALQQYALGIENELPPQLIEARGLLQKKDAIRLIHRPTEMSQVEAARRTLVFEELFQFQKIIAERVYKRKGHSENPVVECERSERIETTAEDKK